MTVVRGLSRQDRRMLTDERRDLMAALRRPRPFWMDTLTWAADRAALRARLREIEEELTA